MIVPIGTKVVAKLPIPGNGSVYPSGTTGEIVNAPSDPQHSYRVRLPDGFETMLKRREFALLSTVQNDGLRPDESALEDHELRDSVIYRCTVGSRAYGLETSTSDTDTRGIYLAPAARQWSLFGVPDQLENRATD